MKLLDMVSAYGVFATGGYRTPPLSILKVETSSGDIKESNKSFLHRVIEPEPAYLINSILSDNESRAPMFGSVSPMYFAGYQVAAKTGTTSDYKDGWIIGYSSSLAAGVWVGNNDNSPMRQDPAVSTAGPIWRNFMNKALTSVPNEPLPLPLPLPPPFLEKENSTEIPLL